MTIQGIVRQCAYYTGICTILMLASGTSNAKKLIPVAVDDTASAISGDSDTLHVDVLANDQRLDDGIADLLIVTAPQFGTTAKAGPDAEVGRLHIHYAYPAGFGGTDTFTYKVVDVDGDASNTATVTITVDGSTARTAPGANKVVFGGAAYPGSNVALSAVGESVTKGGISTVQCCTVRDPRVSAGGNRLTRFDLGSALRQEGSCAAINPKPAAGTLIIPPHFGVHTENLSSTNPEDYRFGVCVVDTGAEWQGPVQVDTVAEPVVGYTVDCKTSLGVHKQPLTLGMSVDPREFTSPEMRAITIECDPRGVTRWSRWFFVVNAVHLADKDESRGYVARMFTTLRSMIEAMRKNNAVDSVFIRDLTSLVLDAQNPSSSATASMNFLDNATLMALTPPGADPYSPTAKFSNPKGELVSHLMALRYAVCSELAHPGNLAQCRINELVDNALPELP